MTYIGDLLRRELNSEKIDASYVNNTEPRIDRWAGFDHRVGEGSLPLRTPPSWVKKPEDRRRILAYRVAKAAQESVIRLWHENDGPFSDYEQLREHGHAGLFIERLTDAVIGEDVAIRVIGADRDVPDVVPLPQKPTEPGEGALPVELDAYATMLEVYTQRAARIIEEWQQDAQRQDDCLALQQWFNSWAEDTRFWEAVLEVESEMTAPLGDGVVVLELDDRSRPRARVFAPDGFFKATEPGTVQDFPDRVHIAWEYETDAIPGPFNSGSTKVIRRITWELLEVADPDAPDQLSAWTPAYATTSTTKRCFFTDAEWVADGSTTDGILIRDTDVDELPLNRARFRIGTNPLDPTGPPVELNRVPLPVDFIPVVHFKHTVGGSWGRSAFARIMGLLDDMSMGDTSAALLSVLVGEPPLIVSGGTVDEDMALGPAVAIDVGPDGKGQKLGFADELRAAIEYNGHLERQFIKMTALSSELSGRENREQSGRAIGLKMTPFRQAILKARLARAHSYALVFKFVQRLALVANTEGFPVDEVHPAEIRWGTFIPEDLTELVEQIILLRDRGLLTDSDVYDLLTAAGMQIADVDASLDELRANNVKVAAPLAEILGPISAAKFMGREYDPESVAAMSPSQGDGPNPTSRVDDVPVRERSNPVPNP